MEFEYAFFFFLYACKWLQSSGGSAVCKMPFKTPPCCYKYCMMLLISRTWSCCRAVASNLNCYRSTSGGDSGQRGGGTLWRASNLTTWKLARNSSLGLERRLVKGGGGKGDIHSAHWVLQPKEPGATATRGLRWDTEHLNGAQTYKRGPAGHWKAIQ